MVMAPAAVAREAEDRALALGDSANASARSAADGLAADPPCLHEARRAEPAEVP